MHPLHRVAWGFLVVFVDLRFGGLDVVPDVLGWVLVITGLLNLSGQHVGYRVALSAARAGDGATANGAKVVRWLDVALGVGSLAVPAVPTTP